MSYGITFKMNHLETSNDKITVDARPLFASAWIALYEVLRKNYNERHLDVPVNPGNSQVQTNETPEKS